MTGDGSRFDSIALCLSRAASFQPSWVRSFTAVNRYDIPRVPDRCDAFVRRIFNAPCPVRVLLLKSGTGRLTGSTQVS